MTAVCECAVTFLFVIGLCACCAVCDFSAVSDCIVLLLTVLMCVCVVRGCAM